MRYVLFAICLFFLISCMHKYSGESAAMPSAHVRIPTTWEFVSLSKKISDDDPFGFKSSALNAVLNEQLKGTTFIVSEDSLIVNGPDGKPEGRGKIIKRDAGSYTLQDEHGKTGALKYKVSADKQTCTFTYEDGSTVLVRKSARPVNH
jgi:hypothetical protein